MIEESGMNATFIKPWYVLGPSHYWAYILLPFYKICEIIPFTRKGAIRLGLVTITNMLNTIIFAVENYHEGIMIFFPEHIKRM
jgi:hypothetical protein